ncbi:MAG: M1 family metallopeptidase [Ignavibacteriales bacterium]|nr:M1 family metallopeptidase [Ignavibacteriales bacterium]
MKFLTYSAILLLFVSTLFGQEIFSPRDAGETPNRTYDVLHYKIEATLFEQTKSVEGNATITLVPLMPALTTARFNAGEMTIKKVSVGGTPAQFHATSSEVSVELGKKYSQRDTVLVSIAYSCTPRLGLTFNGPDSAYPSKRLQIWSQGEDTTNHFWFPCYDYPNDKATSEVIGTVNSKFVFLSNGKLVNVKEDKKKGTKTFHWKEEKPHSSYLIMIAAGEFAVLKDRVGKLPLEYYVYPNDTANARETFRHTPSMISFFNQTIGFDYPWEKYGQIILQDHFGGMENSSATTLSDNWAVPEKRARLDVDPRSLIAHELAHQWWGDVVTCKDFRHVWLNESFASYYDPLYFEYVSGRDEFDLMMYQGQQAGIVVDTTKGRKPIVSVESYGENVYPRGASVLHMLRFLLGDDLYHRAIKHYITKHQFQPVETNDLKVAIEEATGQNLQWFFDQWVYKAGHPNFELSYAWNETAKNLALRVKQVQRQDSLTGIFRMPVEIEATTATGSETHRVGVVTADTTFTLPCSQKPMLVIFDKGNWLLKELKWEKPAEEWRYQAASAKNPIDRIRALQALAPSLENASVIADRLLHDPFWGVRREAAARSGSLAAVSDTMKPALRAALLQASHADTKPSVRDAAVSALRFFKGKDVAESLHRSLEDSSYNVMSSALRSLVRVDSANAAAILRAYLDYPSRLNGVSNTALSSLASLDSSFALSVAVQRTAYGQINSTRYTSLGIIRRYGRGNALAIQTLVHLLTDKNDAVKTNAAQILGDIGDASVIPALEAVPSDAGGGFYLLSSSTAKAAKASIEKIKKRSEQKK